MKRENIVSIRNMHEVGELDVLDFITAHLLSQNQRSAKGLLCKYKQDNLRCAVGCLIPDEDYHESLEGSLWGNLVEAGLMPRAHMEVLAQAQFIHDFFSPYEWTEKLAELRNKVEREVIVVL